MTVRVPTDDDEMDVEVRFRRKPHEGLYELDFARLKQDVLAGSGGGR